MPTKVSFANTKNADMLYLLKMEIPDPFFFIDTGSEQLVFLDHREYGVFEEKNTNPSIRPVHLEPFLEKARASEGLNHEHALALVIFKEYGLLNSEVAVSNHFPLDLADVLRSHGAVLTPVDSFCPERERKTEQEKEYIRAAIRDTQGAYELVESILKESVIRGNELFYRGAVLTSEVVKKEIDRLLFDRGLLNVEGMIVSCGSHAAIPHHDGNGPIRPHQTIIVDLFPRSRVNGYFADMTRTYVKGAPNEQMFEMYEAVKDVQERSISMVRPGVTGKEIYEACVQWFVEKGFHAGEKGFTHGTGHGLGLEIHETPYVNRSGTKPLEVGNVITIEPGLYYPEYGGVRIEDVLYVTENGAENLTNYPKQFIIA